MREVISIKTIVYILRHSQPFRDLLGDYYVEEQEQIRNEKNPLSVIGEKRAEKLSKYKELQNIDIIYSSHYVRAMSTAKYIAKSNHIKLNIDQRFGERKFGIKTWEGLPQDFFKHQFYDWNYKLNDGESLNEVHTRMNEALLEVLNKNEGKKIMIVAHGTSLSVMLSTWCDVKLNEETNLIELYFNGHKFFEGDWNAPELFKLEFENNNLMKIENIHELHQL